ncbi:MAG: hypothetical protein NC453_18520 [Muribaculum sp.]|nr:hypothetical protein [Muribaculum sp.]
MNDEELNDDMAEILPQYDSEAEPIHWLSEEVKDVFGCEFPNIDQFQKHRAFIGIPREIISDIIHKGNSMKLVATPFTCGKEMADAFDRDMQMMHWDVNEIIDCFAGIFISKNVKITADDLADFSAHLDEVLPKLVEPFWGFYQQDELPDGFGQIITVATKKRKNEPLHDTDLPF